MLFPFQRLWWNKEGRKQHNIRFHSIREWSVLQFRIHLFPCPPFVLVAQSTDAWFTAHSLVALLAFLCSMRKCGKKKTYLWQGQMPARLQTMLNEAYISSHVGSSENPNTLFYTCFVFLWKIPSRIIRRKKHKQYE